LPASGYGLGALIDSRDPHQSYLCSADGQSALPMGAFAGVLAGALLAGAIDVGMSQEPSLAPPPGRIKVTGLRVAPTVLLTRDRASLTLVGRLRGERGPQSVRETGAARSCRKSSAAYGEFNPRVSPFKGSEQHGRNRPLE
jgi:hypothetical protein